jgi:hypothetical protein
VTPRLTPNLRATALLLLGALLLHELRYALAFGAGADEALARHGHGYMEQLVPVLVALSGALLAGAVLAPLTGRLARVSPGSRLVRRTGIYAALLLAVFCAQELAEAWLASGHPDGIDAVLGHGGWVAIPLALLHGALAALATRGLEQVELRLLAVRQPHPSPTPAAGPGPVSEAAGVPPLATLTLAFGLARRPPPLSLPV